MEAIHAYFDANPVMRYVVGFIGVIIFGIYVRRKLIREDSPLSNFKEKYPNCDVYKLIFEMPDEASKLRAYPLGGKYQKGGFAFKANLKAKLDATSYRMISTGNKELVGMNVYLKSEDDGKTLADTIASELNFKVVSIEKVALENI